jgi:hypothetical protein
MVVEDIEGRRNDSLIDGADISDEVLVTEMFLGKSRIAVINVIAGTEVISPELFCGAFRGRMYGADLFDPRAKEAKLLLKSSKVKRNFMLKELRVVVKITVGLLFLQIPSQGQA